MKNADYSALAAQFGTPLYIYDFDEIGQPLPCQFLLFEKKL